MPVVLAAACRTPFTPADGALAGWHPVDLAAVVMNEAIDRAGLPAEAVDEVWVGCAEPVGAQGADMARAAVLTAGWPDHIGGSVIDRAETSGSAAIHAAAAAIHAGTVGTAVVIGVCSASVVQPGAAALARTYGRPWGDGPAARVEGRGGLLPPARAAEVAAIAAGLTREDQDDVALRSHQRRADAATPALIVTHARPGDRAAVQKGAPLTADARRELGADPRALPPSFDVDGTVTALTFAPPADGVAALVLTTAGIGRAELVTTTAGVGRAELVATGRAAGDPLDPCGGVEAALRHAGIAADLIDRWEITETTAAGLILICERLGLDPAETNTAGGTLAVGDAAAAEELRLSIDGLAVAAVGEIVAAVAAGPTGSAVTIWRRTADDAEISTAP